MMLRTVLPIAIGVAACLGTLFIFDWRSIGATLSAFDYARFILLGIPISMAVLVTRTIRWTAVAGMSFAPLALWRTHLQTALSIAAAALTPLQLGEALKLKLARDSGAGGWHKLTAAFAMERIADMAAILTLAAIGLRGGQAIWLAPAAIVMALGFCIVPFALRIAATLFKHGFLGRMFAPFSDFELSATRLLLVGFGTAGKWFSVVALWQLAIACSGVTLTFAQCASLVAGVTISVAASMVPVGLGVAELSARQGMIWMGIAPSAAEAGAIALRLISPLIIGLGLLHGLLLIKYRTTDNV